MHIYINNYLPIRNHEGPEMDKSFTSTICLISTLDNSTPWQIYTGKKSGPFGTEG
jgi:hypothetical protein